MYYIKSLHYITKQPLVANNAQPIQTAVKLPVFTTYSETHNNHNQQSGSGLWSGKTYKRETIFKFYEGSVEVYVSFFKTLNWPSQKSIPDGQRNLRNVTLMANFFWSFSLCYQKSVK